MFLIKFVIIIYFNRKCAENVNYASLEYYIAYFGIRADRGPALDYDLDAVLGRSADVGERVAGRRRCRRRWWRPLLAVVRDAVRAPGGAVARLQPVRHGGAARGRLARPSGARVRARRRQPGAARRPDAGRARLLQPPPRPAGARLGRRRPVRLHRPAAARRVSRRGQPPPSSSRPAPGTGSNTLSNTNTVISRWPNTTTVFDLISEHALISGHPTFFVKKKYLFSYFNLFYFNINNYLK